ncbi:MAG: stage 0 sporulation family protein [Clostridia bacterium]|nr:stage 0 sporulation family protein [Clostridia bacterium]
MNENESDNELVEVIGVSFQPSGKVYHFDANGQKAKNGDGVIVETARGIEYGAVIVPNTLIKKKDLVLPLKPVIRLATKEDRLHYEDNKRREQSALAICADRIAAHGLDMKLVDAEYTFDNSKLLFYFTSDDRVDFRELVKDLAAHFRTRIELRQIGIRDETKLMGGLGVCYRDYCCHSFLNDFAQVSIKMAKDQGLSLNSSKISGACGRLMCCLKFEYETYEEEIKKCPKVGARVISPDGPGEVTEIRPLAGQVRVKLDADPDGVPKLYDRDTLVKEGENASPAVEPPKPEPPKVEEKPKLSDIAQDFLNLKNKEKIPVPEVVPVEEDDREEYDENSGSGRYEGKRSKNNMRRKRNKKNRFNNQKAASSESRVAPEKQKDKPDRKTRENPPAGKSANAVAGAVSEFLSVSKKAVEKAENEVKNGGNKKNRYYRNKRHNKAKNKNKNQ